MQEKAVIISANAKSLSPQDDISEVSRSHVKASVISHAGRFLQGKGQCRICPPLFLEATHTLSRGNAV